METQKKYDPSTKGNVKTMPYSKQALEELALPVEVLGSIAGGILDFEGGECPKCGSKLILSFCEADASVYVQCSSGTCDYAICSPNW